MKTAFTYLLLFLLIATRSGAQLIFADSQTSGTSGLCLCSMSNAPLATDGNITTCSSMNLGVSVAGARIYQDLKFSIPGGAGETVGAVVQDVNALTLSISLLNSVSLTTYSNGVSNNDTKTSSQFNIRLITGSSALYAIEFVTNKSFDMLRVEMAAGVVSAMNGLNVYYGYHTVTVLPVEELNFKAQTQQGLVNLSWNGTDESNLGFYILERSSDAKTFTPIADIDQTGTQDHPGSYAFSDRQPLEGLSYYRLKRAAGGSVKELGITPVTYTVEVSGGLVIFPNPGSGDLNLRCDLKKDEHAAIALYNERGEIVRQYAISAAGTEMLSEKLDAGIYFCRYSVNDGQVITKKIVVQK